MGLIINVLYTAETFKETPTVPDITPENISSHLDKDDFIHFQNLLESTDAGYIMVFDNATECLIEDTLIRPTDSDDMRRYLASRLWRSVLLWGYAKENIHLRYETKEERRFREADEQEEDDADIY